MERLSGFVQKITYRNDENGYTVLLLKTEGGEECLVGTFPTLSEGEFIEAEGEFVTHPLYGPQMKVSRFDFVAPAGAREIEQYLSSGVIRGIGEKMARRIVEKFGDDTFRILEEEPERLAEVKGISERSAMEIAAQVLEKREMRSAILYLQQYGVSVQMAVRIHKIYGESLYAVMRENPYRLAEDVRGIGFKTADEIAMKMQIPYDSDFRVKSAVLYVLSEAGAGGHTYLPRDVLFSRVEALLSLEIGDFDHLIEDLYIEGKIVLQKDADGARIYLRRMFKMEQDTARMLRELNVQDESLSQEALRREILKLEKEEKIELDPMQREAVLTAARSGVTIMTGGPGTGKTTTINMMIKYFLREGFDLLLAAPTGRAAKRMTEATGCEAMTIHRMLEVSGRPEEMGSGVEFGRNRETPLEADVVIIDEMSMVDISLMYALLSATVQGMRLVFVGDVDQLPSVGPGEVLRDMIRSSCFPVVRLDRVFRQAEESDIIINAHKINAGEPVEVKPSKDFLFILRDDPAKIVGATITLLKEKLPGYVHADPNELQVLTPMRKGVLGVENLNKLLQEAFNPPSDRKREKEIGGILFREGDKVMQIRNDYNLAWEIRSVYPPAVGTGVFNGDIGIIRSISHFEENMTVEFEEGKCVVYPFSSCDELELAYAVTIHKSQGSEYPAVIIPLYQGPELLMNRNLLYTGVTRAKSCVSIVGRYDTFARMIRNAEVQRRCTGLCEMIVRAHESY